MAKPTTYQGSLVGIFIEDTGNPGTYIRPCGLNDHTLSFSKGSNDVNVPDCDDPNLPAWVERETESLDFTASGSGILAAESIDTWWAAFANTASINGRIYVGAEDDVTNGKFWAGKLLVTAFEVTGNRGSKSEINVTVVSDGELTYTDVT